MLTTLYGIFMKQYTLNSNNKNTSHNDNDDYNDNDTTTENSEAIGKYQKKKEQNKSKHFKAEHKKTVNSVNKNRV